MGEETQNGVILIENDWKKPLMDFHNPAYDQKYYPLFTNDPYGHGTNTIINLPRAVYDNIQAEWEGNHDQIKAMNLNFATEFFKMVKQSICMRDAVNIHAMRLIVPAEEFYDEVFEMLKKTEVNDKYTGKNSCMEYIIKTLQSIKVRKPLFIGLFTRRVQCVQIFEDDTRSVNYYTLIQDSSFFCRDIESHTYDFETIVKELPFNIFCTAQDMEVAKFCYENYGNPYFREQTKIEVETVI